MVAIFCVSVGMFTSEVQFGHAGSCANTDKETAVVKNKALADAGAYVPDSFDTLGDLIGDVYERLVLSGVIVPAPEVPPPTVPMDYSWARVRKYLNPQFIFSVLYCGTLSFMLKVSWNLFL